MDEGTQVDVVMLGLSGFRALGAVEEAGEVEVRVETVRARVGCPGCGVIAVSHGRREVLVRDVAAFGRPVRLRWRKRLWRCHEPLCDRITWTEQHAAVGGRVVDRPGRASLTDRAARRVCRDVGRDGRSVAAVAAVAAVAREYGVGWHTAMRAVEVHGRPLVDDPARLDGVAALGMDETAFLKANRLHHTTYVSGLVDTATGRLLDVVPDRTAKAVADWLSAQGAEWLAQVGLVSLDPHRGYANAVGVHLGHATLVVDHFHVVQLANRVVDDVRRRVQHETTGHRAAAPPRRPAVRGPQAAAGRLRPTRHPRLGTSGRPDRRGRPRRAGRGRLAAALLIKKIKRAGHGFRIFDNYRLRLLLHCGVTWHDAPAARIRGRTPPLAA